MSHAPAALRIGLAAAPNFPSVADRLDHVDIVLAGAATEGAAIVCFPETYLPGLRGMDFAVPPPDQARQIAALEQIQATSARTGVAMIMGMEWQTDRGMLNLAMVINRDGTIQGHQAKNQIAPSEEPFYVPEGTRRLFEIDGIPFGITICHEGWRYPESVRWSATRGAQVVFHPHVTGSDEIGHTPAHWGDPAAPYYEKAMISRAVENSVWFASVNCATRHQESATSIISPEGECVAHVPYGQAALLVHDLDLAQATRQYAQRFNPEFYPTE